MLFISNLKKFVVLAILTASIFACSDDDDGNINTINTEFTIAALAASDSELSDFITALQATDLLDSINSTIEYTVLAPTNAAFENFLASNDDYNDIADVPKEILTPLLLNHIIDGGMVASQFTDTGYERTIATFEDDVDDDKANNPRISIYYDANNGLVFNNSATVVTADIEASNGVMHKVDNIMPLPTITSTITIDPNLSRLREALETADLLETVENFEKVTVLGPTNEAFEAAAEITGEELANLLKNHLVSTPLTSVALTEEGSNYINTLSPASTETDDFLSLYYNTTEGVIFNGISTVVIPDIVTTNGIIHVVDAVINLPLITDFIGADPSFSQLLTALSTSTPDTDFVGILSRTSTDNSDGINAPFTVFAPINTAFMDFGDLPDADTLTGVLQTHVVSGMVLRSTQFTNGTITSLNGELTINAQDSTVKGVGNEEGILIATKDIRAINGVIHGINAVLLSE